MRLKLYRAGNMAEAMTRVRLELGPDALILGTRRVGGGIELTAALEPEEGPPVPPVVQPADPDRVALLNRHGIPPEMQARLLAQELRAALAGALRFQDLPLQADAPPLLLVGPPGAGKTLTIVRLATRLVMAGILPTVVTTDGKRAGAVEQLAAFAKLLALEVTVACHPVTLGRALAHRARDAPALIDTPGCDPFDPDQRDELLAVATTSGAQMVLVLEAGLDPAEAAETARAYKDMGAGMLVATKLDLARRLGGVLAAAHAGGLALTEAGIGSGAADGLIPITPDWLAERLTAIRTERHP